MGNKLLVLLAVAVGVGLTVSGRVLEGRESLASFTPGPEPVVQATDESQQSILPCALDSGLMVEMLTDYEGPYMEDGSDEPVSGVAALMLRNTGTRDISSAMITVKQGHQVLHFYVTWLPAGQKVLVLEYDRQMYFNAPVTECASTGVRWESFYPEGSMIWITEEGEQALTVVNCSAETASHVRLRYKTYIEDGDFYLGGFTYSVYVGNLASGECRTVYPGHYARGASGLVAVLTQ
jgi:hypothetical protein